MAKTMAMPRQPETEKEKATAFPFSRRYPPMAPKDSTPSSSPFTRPTRISFQTSSAFSFRPICVSISTRIATARDWVPTLPAISSTRDWKHMMMGSCATMDSNSPTVEETPSPITSSAHNQGIRFRTLWRIGSARSSSEDRPASLA